jgi:hypothetical protein
MISKVSWFYDLWNISHRSRAAELSYRRECIVATLSSLQTHFLSLYTARGQSPQCKRFLDNAAACDSFQLGEMVKFFTNKNLLRLPGFAFDGYHEPYSGDIEQLITTLRQVPSYQIDKNHSHCGLRTRILPLLEYIQSMINGNLGINRQSWKVDRTSHAWSIAEKGEKFTMTRDTADPRLRMEGNIVVDRYAKRLFTASGWDWTPEESKPSAAISWSAQRPVLK